MIPEGAHICSPKTPYTPQEAAVPKEFQASLVRAESRHPAQACGQGARGPGRSRLTVLGPGVSGQPPWAADREAVFQVWNPRFRGGFFPTGPPDPR